MKKAQLSSAQHELEIPLGMPTFIRHTFLSHRVPIFFYAEVVLKSAETRGNRFLWIVCHYGATVMRGGITDRQGDGQRPFLHPRHNWPDYSWRIGHKTGPRWTYIPFFSNFCDFLSLQICLSVSMVKIWLHEVDWKWLIASPMLQCCRELTFGGCAVVVVR